MRLLELSAGLIAATVLHTAAVRSVPESALLIDFFLIATLFLTLGRHAAWAILVGTVLGLAHDALSGGPYGLHGFANTFVAWAAALLQTRLVVQGGLEIALLFSLAAALQQAVLAALQFFLVPSSELPQAWSMLMIMVTTGLAGALLATGSRRLQTAIRAWKEQRRRRLTIETR